MEGFNKNSSFNFNYVFSSAAKSYNLKIHYQQNHPSIFFPDDKVISNKELSAFKKLVIYS